MVGMIGDRFSGLDPGLRQPGHIDGEYQRFHALCLDQTSYLRVMWPIYQSDPAGPKGHALSAAPKGRSSAAKIAHQVRSAGATTALVDADRSLSCACPPRRYRYRETGPSVRRGDSRRLSSGFCCSPDAAAVAETTILQHHQRQLAIPNFESVELRPSPRAATALPRFARYTSTPKSSRW